MHCTSCCTVRSTSTPLSVPTVVSNLLSAHPFSASISRQQPPATLVQFPSFSPRRTFLPSDPGLILCADHTLVALSHTNILEAISFSHEAAAIKNLLYSFHSLSIRANRPLPRRSSSRHHYLDILLSQSHFGVPHPQHPSARPHEFLIWRNSGTPIADHPPIPALTEDREVLVMLANSHQHNDDNNSP